jgi:hypothetical protein
MRNTTRPFLTVGDPAYEALFKWQAAGVCCQLDETGVGVAVVNTVWPKPGTSIVLPRPSPPTHSMNWGNGTMKSCRTCDTGNKHEKLSRGLAQNTVQKPPIPAIHCHFDSMPMVGQNAAMGTQRPLKTIPVACNATLTNTVKLR